MAQDGAMAFETVVLADILGLTAAALPEVETIFTAGRESLRAMVTRDGRISNAALEEHQFAAHCLSWLATYAQGLQQMQAWAMRLDSDGTFGAMEALILQIGFGEYLTQIYSGIPMSQGETARLQDLRILPAPAGAAAACLMAQGNTAAARMALVALM